MTKNRVLQYISSLGLTLCFILSFVSVGWSQNPLAPNWNLDNLGSQIRVLDHDYNGLGYLIGGGSLFGNANNNSLTIRSTDGSMLTVAPTNYASLWHSGGDFVAGGAVYDAFANGNTLTIDNSSVTARTAIGGAALLRELDLRLSSGTANYNTVNILNGSYISESPMVGTTEQIVEGTNRTVYFGAGGYVIGGFTNYANGHADYNTVNIDGSTVTSGVYGGYAKNFLIKDSDYEDGVPIVPISITANYNTVNITNNSLITVADSDVDHYHSKGVVGGYGGEHSTGNTVNVDHSTVYGDIYGGVPGWTVYQGSVATGSVTNNTVVLSNLSVVVGSVYGAEGYSVNAYNNSVYIDNSSVSGGRLQAAKDGLLVLKGTPINAQMSGNELYLGHFNNPLNLDEIGAGLNWAGVSNDNTVLLEEITNLTVARGMGNSFQSKLWTRAENEEDEFKNVQLDIASLQNQNLFTVPVPIREPTPHGFSLDYDETVVSDPGTLKTNLGFIYGGAAFDYTRQIDTSLETGPQFSSDTGELITGSVPAEEIWANGGTNADGNTIHIANSSVTANIFGGIAGEMKEINYYTWGTKDVETASGTETHFTQTHVYKDGNTIYTTVFDCGTDGSSCAEVIADSSSETPEPLDDVYSASNNTIVLENSHFDGTLYAGYVVGADLKTTNAITGNNTVILRGNATLANDALLFGGNAVFNDELGLKTNHLIFDRVGNNGSFVTYHSKGQFGGFNPTWQINADWDTRINFDFNGVEALVTMDPSAMGRENAGTEIIRTQTAADLTLLQNGERTEVFDNSLGLAQKRVGLFTYDLTPVKVDNSTIGWVMSGYKDQNNAEVYGSLPIVGLALVSEGPDMLSTAFQDAWTADAESNTFINSGYHKTRYETGSGFDLNSALVQAGWWKKLAPDFMMGLFAKYVHGSYETYPIKADGSANAFGGGLMVSYHYSDTGRLEGDVEVGYLKADFNSAELLSTLRAKGMYYGFMGGIVEQPLQNWEIFARLNAFRKAKDSMTDSLGQNIKYEAMQSLTLRAGTEVAFEDWMFSGLVPSLGASVLYEFAGASKVQVLDISNDDASLKGLSGRGQVGLKYQNEELPLPILSQLVVYGQVGKRRGFGGEINISFQF